MAEAVVRKRVLLLDEHGARRRAAILSVVEGPAEGLAALADVMVARLAETVDRGAVAGSGTGVVLGDDAPDCSAWHAAAAAALGGTSPLVADARGGLGARLEIPLGDGEKIEVGVVDAPAPGEAVLIMAVAWYRR